MRRNQLSVLLTGLASAALAAMAAAAPVMAAVSENSPGGGNSESGERIEEAAEDRKDALREGQSAEAEEEITSAATPGVTPRNGQETKAGTEENAPPATQNGKADAETAGVYEFPDTKTSGTVTVVKKWDDQSTNAERPRADISISAQKPSKSPLGYTVTFHADTENGLTFTDGSTENEVVYNGSGQIVSGAYKGLAGESGVVRWYTDKTYQTQVELNADGTPAVPLTRDVDVWPKEVTFEIKGYANSTHENKFKQAIPNTVITVVFTDEAIPADAALIDVDADGDGGVVAWMEGNGTVMKVSTQIAGVKVQAAKNSARMFYGKSKIQTIDFTNLDTSQVTDMNNMFSGCSGLTSLDVSSFNTAKVTDMSLMFSSCGKLTSLDVSKFDTSQVTRMDDMFSGCHGLTSLDLSSFDTSQVTYMNRMFKYCRSLTSLDLSPLDTSKVTDMSEMFYYCSSLTSLDLTPLDTSQVTNMTRMFSNCSGLTRLDVIGWGTSKVKNMYCMFDSCSNLTNLNLTGWDTSNVTDMWAMFSRCSGLTSLDLTPLDTSKVTKMAAMFSGCSALTSLDLTPLDTSNVTDMTGMFSGCSGLTSFDLTPLDTSKVTKMGNMFYGCSALTSLDLTPLDTSNVTDMREMFLYCRGLTHLTTGANFKFIGTNYALSGTWQNTAGETFTSGNFPSNVADTYTRIAS